MLHHHLGGSSHATHPALHLRDASDAHVVFEAVRRGAIPLIKRRLTAEERDQLASGNVFVWEEAEHKGGLERWTDGRRWSQSRMKGDYLFYEEKIDTTQEEKEAKAARRANKPAGPTVPSRRQDRPAKPDGLTKQTYSTLVYLPGQSTPRKWHIVAYFSENDYTRLPVIESYESLRNIRVPDGVFFSGKGSMKKGDRYSANPESHDRHSIDDSMALEPSTLQGHIYSIPSSGTVPYYPTPELACASNGSLPLRQNSHDPTSLPRLSTIAPLQPQHPISAFGTSPTHHMFSQLPNRTSNQYSPLSAEDRRALNTFRVIL